MSTDSCYESDTERTSGDTEEDFDEVEDLLCCSASSDSDRPSLLKTVSIESTKTKKNREQSDDDDLSVPSQPLLPAAVRSRNNISPSPSPRANAGSPGRGLLPKTKALIIEAIADCLSLTGIANKLRLHGVTVPALSQLNAFIEWYKQKTDSPPSRSGPEFDFTLADLIDYASSRTAIPKDANRPYVLSFFIERTASGRLGFQVIWTTVNMLRVQSESPSLHIDCRHRLSWQGYPVLCSGAVDANHHFFPTSLTLMSDVDNVAAFRSMLTTLQAAVCSQKSLYSPKVLVTDHQTPALYQAVCNLYPSAIHAVCWTHIRAELEQELTSRVSSKRDRASAWEAIELLRQAECENQFVASGRLLVAQWKTDGDEMSGFAEYFAQRWLSAGSSKAWYEGRSPCSMSNAGIEQLVTAVTDNSQRWQCNLAYRQFFHQVEQLCASWSTKRNPSAFMTAASMSQSLLTDAAEFGAASEPMLRRGDGDSSGREVIAMAGDGSGTPKRLADLTVSVDAYMATVRQNCTVDSWAKFKQLRFGVVIMERCSRTDGYNQWRCNCPTGIANRPCKHVILHRMRLGEIATPTPRIRKSSEPSCELSPDGTPIKRKRGRPRKIRPVEMDDDLQMQLAHKIARIDTSSPLRSESH